MADKDTRDDLGAYGDPIPVADVPPSEGGPVSRDSPPDTPTSEALEKPPGPPHNPAMRADARTGIAPARDGPRVEPAIVEDPTVDEPFFHEPWIAPWPEEAAALELDPAPPIEPPAPEADAIDPSEAIPDTGPQDQISAQRMPDTAWPELEHAPQFEAKVSQPDLTESDLAEPEVPAPAEDAAARAPPDAVEPSPVPEAETAPPAVAADDRGSWRAAIADALFEPSPPAHEDPVPSARAEPPPPLPIEPAAEAPVLAPPAPEASPPASVPAYPRASIELLPERSAPAPSDWRLEARPAPTAELDQPPHSPDTPHAPDDSDREQAQSDASFTAAAEDLFRPPEIERDPHLITLGRRLDPSLRIPRPVAPVIAPRYEPDPETHLRPTWKTASWQDRLWITGRYAAYAAGGYLALVLVLIVLFRFVNPPGSMLMLTKLLTGNSVDRTWVPLEQISPALVRAVIVSEDGRFCEHSGIDTHAIKDAIERASGGVARGASTISMQVTKNLFLWNAKSYIRKVIEIPLTLVMEIVWPKRRILEMYLNIAEWGPGVFGAEAAARHHFNKPAYRLNEREAALLAAVLPNPVRRDAGSPNTLTSSKARVVQARVKAYGAIAACVVGPQSRALEAAAPPAAPGNATATPRNQPARKTTPQRKAPRRETIEDWGATVRMGPQ
ncbi:monofunctional biosynthetic peptidoglycan transglycosylase [Hyphomicrobium sp.]|uniref:monofunctional biosynthetic peptidoglycan transglycosylase n=1 Tax=Hyphomicrobium sp. TaxID=82 RepID=UPI003F706CB9